MASPFLPLYKETIASCAGNEFRDNFDSRRFSKLRGLLASCSPAAGFMKSFRSRRATRRGLAFVEPHREKIEWLCQQLSDEESKQTLIRVLAYRALGYRKVKLPLNNPDYWASIESIERQMQGAESIELGFKGWQAHRINLAGIGYPIELFFRPSGIVTQFVLQQYRCQTPDGTIEASEGDTVLDGGGCYGDTALYFAHKTGAKGRVYSFEFLPGNLRIFRRNLALNTSLSERIRIVEHPLWSKTGEKLFIKGHGPGTRVVAAPGYANAQEIETVSIDDFVRREGIPKADFIKMDIEGAELQALQGAAETLRRFRPKLAITVYHRLEDFWTIPQYLDTLKLGYRFYLRHFTIHAEETVLFAETASTR